MGFYPMNLQWEWKIQSDVAGVNPQFHAIVEFALGSPVVDDVDLIVTSANMKVGAYTVAAQPDVPRNITVTQTAVDAEDTNGTIVVVGTDIAGNAISETITPNSGVTVAGAKAFKTVTSVTGAGWEIGGGNDTVTVGVGSLIGLPLALTADALVFAGTLNGTREATLPVITKSTSVLSQNTVDFTSAWDGNAGVLFVMI
jgi:hypothetical protein